MFHDALVSFAERRVISMDIRLDEGFLFGMGAFETIAVEKGKPILLEKHIERLEKAADFFKLGSCSER